MPVIRISAAGIMLDAQLTTLTTPILSDLSVLPVLSPRVQRSTLFWNDVLDCHRNAGASNPFPFTTRRELKVANLAGS